MMRSAAIYCCSNRVQRESRWQRRAQPTSKRPVSGTIALPLIAAHLPLDPDKEKHDGFHRRSSTGL